MNGGIINGTITVNGEVFLNGSSSNGSEVTSIPFKWKLKYNNLYYTSGNVGLIQNHQIMTLKLKI